MTKKNLKTSEKFIYTRFFSIFLITVFVGITVGFGFVIIFRNIDILWNFFNPDDVTNSDDIIPPPPPILLPLPKATNKELITIEGYSEEGAKVTCSSSNLSAQQEVADNQGHFVFNDIRLQKGENEFYFIAKDSANNESSKSEILKITLDTEKPKLEIISPKNGAQIRGEENKQVKIIGKSDPETNIFVNDSLAITDNQGNFYFFLTLISGENKINLKAADEAGNTQSEEITLWYSP